MIIAILSDAHDNIWKLAELLEDIGRTDAGTLIFCGDLCAPFTLKQIGDEFDGPVHVVKGNNDGDMLFMSRVADSLDNVNRYGGFAGVLLLHGVRSFWLPWGGEVGQRYHRWALTVASGQRAPNGTASLSLTDCEQIGREFTLGDFLPAVLDG